MRSVVKTLLYAGL